MAAAEILECVVNAIDEEKKNIPGKRKTKKLVKAIDTILDVYSKENFTSDDPDEVKYDQAKFRCAYLYKYAPIHIQAIAHFMQNIEGWIEQMVCDRNRFRICSLGGGPGTDIFGFLEFVDEVDWWDDREITGAVLDFYPEWETTYKLLKEEMDCDDDLSIKYQKFNFFEDCNPAALQEVHNADMVMMVKVLSALNPAKFECTENLQMIVERMKVGSILFYLDNANDELTETIQDIADQEGLREILLEEKVKINLNANLSSYREQFGGIIPSKQTTFTVAAWKKEIDIHS